MAVLVLVLIGTNLVTLATLAALVRLRPGAVGPDGPHAVALPGARTALGAERDRPRRPGEFGA